MEEHEQTTTTRNDPPLDPKWGETLKGGFVVIPAALLRFQDRLGLGDSEVVVLAHLLMSWWEPEKWPFPHTSTIAKRMGNSRRTVQRRIEGLEAKGFIRRVWGKGTQDQERAAARYDLSGTVAKLEPLGRDMHPARQKDVSRSRVPVAPSASLFSDDA